MIRHALKDMGLAKLIGHGIHHLVPPASENEERLGNRRPGAKNGPQGKGQRALSRHTGLGQFKPGVKSDKKPAASSKSTGNSKPSSNNKPTSKNSNGSGAKKSGNKPGNRSRIR